MRLYEFAGQEVEPEGVADDLEATLLGVISQLRGRSHDFGHIGDFSTDAFIQVVHKAGVPFNYKALVRIYEKSKSLKNVISGINRDSIKFADYGDEIDAAPDEEVPDTVGIDPQAKVSQMANRALNNRS